MKPTSSAGKRAGRNNYVFVLIQFTPLRRPGIYVRTLVLGEPAEQDGRLQIGDRILAVNGKSLVGSDYQRLTLLSIS